MKVKTQPAITITKTDKEIHFVCVREDGTYITPRTMQHTSRVIHNELNIKEFDFHSLRHTHATVLLERGAPLKYIQQRLGHKKIDITLNVYQHQTDHLAMIAQYEFYLLQLRVLTALMVVPYHHRFRLLIQTRVS